MDTYETVPLRVRAWQYRQTATEDDMARVSRELAHTRLPGQPPYLVRKGRTGCVMFDALLERNVIVEPGEWIVYSGPLNFPRIVPDKVFRRDYRYTVE